jgi:hypothetical protein
VDEGSHVLQTPICLLQGGTYVIAAALADTETFRADTFEGLEIPLARLWT